MQPKTSVYIATSFDGFIARPDGSIDWLEFDSQGDDYGYAEFMAGIDSLVLGRVSFQQVLGFDEWIYSGKHMVVPSSTLTNDDVPERHRAEVEVLNGSPSELLEELAASGYKHAWIDGGNTIQRFLRDGLIDEIIVTRIPVLIGEGIPLFGALEADINLRHINTSAYAGGVVQSRYAVIRDAPGNN